MTVKIEAACIDKWRMCLLIVPVRWVPGPRIQSYLTIGQVDVVYRFDCSGSDPMATLSAGLGY